MTSSNDWYDGSIKHLVDREGIQKLLPHKKKSTYSKKIPLTNLETESESGWSLVKASKYTCIVEKKKPEFERFQDMVWVMLAEMGFSYLPEDDFKFKVEIDEEQKKQIDVFGIDDEDVVVLAECKAANPDAQQKKGDFRDDINDILQYKGKVCQHLNPFFKTKPRYIFLFCTSNYIVNDVDKKQMENGGIIWMDSNRIDYYRSLTSQLGSLAKYQFFGEILEGKEIPGMKALKVSAIRAKLGEHMCYSMMLTPSVLLKLGFVLHRTDGSSKRGTYQRYVKRQRLASVKEYIQNGGFFPNSIIVNFDQDLDFQVGPSTMQPLDNVRAGLLTLPAKYKSAFIIDGQHRLYGYADTQQKKTDLLPVIAFTKLQPEKQTNMFVDINTKAKAVKRNLIESLNGELYWNSKSAKYALSALHSILALELNGNSNSALFGLIQIGDNTSSSHSRAVTLTFFVDCALKKEKFFVIDFSKNGSPLSYGPLYDGDLADNSLSKGFQVLNYFFNKVKSMCPTQWNVLLNNIGISTLSFMFSEFLFEKRNNSPDIFNNKKAKEVIQIVSPRVDLFCMELAKKNEEEVLSYIDGLYGYGGVDKAKRPFERFMHEADKTFNQPGLEEWIVEQSGKYTDSTASLLSILSEDIISFVEEKLIAAYGQNYYQNPKIPEKLSTKILQRIRKSETPPTHTLEFIDIREVILASWTQNAFDKVFGDPKIKGTKEERTDWLKQLVSIQTKISNQEKLSQADYKLAFATSEWLIPNISNLNVQVKCNVFE